MGKANLGYLLYLYLYIILISTYLYLVLYLYLYFLARHLPSTLNHLPTPHPTPTTQLILLNPDAERIPSLILILTSLLTDSGANSGSKIPTLADPPTTRTVYQSRAK